MERRALLALVSLIRDRCEYWNGEWQDDFYSVKITLHEFYRRMIPAYDPNLPNDLQRKSVYQRQAIRRALGRLLDCGFITAIALAWCEVPGGGWIGWQGGGSCKRKGKEFPTETPRWRTVGLDELGFRLALLLEKESAQK